MIDKKITAVEWLMTQLPMGLKIPIADKLEQAKQMEKEQIKYAYRDGRSDQMSKEGRFYNRNAEYYFKQTYEK